MKSSRIINCGIQYGPHFEKGGILPCLVSASMPKTTRCRLAAELSLPENWTIRETLPRIYSADGRRKTVHFPYKLRVPGGISSRVIVEVTVTAKKGKNVVKKKIKDVLGNDFVKTWMVVGPFENKDTKAFKRIYPPEKKVDFKRTYIGKNKKRIKWKKHFANSGMIDFVGLYAPDNLYAVAYAHNCVKSPVERDVILEYGSDDAGTVWFNGKKIFNKDVIRSAIPGTDKMKIRLKKGENTFLLKVLQYIGGWGFYFTLVNPDESSVKDVKWLF